MIGEEATYAGFYLNDTDRFMIIAAVRADYGGGLSFTRAMELLREVQNEVPAHESDSKLDLYVRVAEAMKRELRSP